MGTTPPPPNLKVAISAFDHDVRLWDDNAKTLDSAEKAATALAIDSKDFGLAELFGLAEKYSQVQQMVVARCGEGRDEFRNVAANLIAAKNAYLLQEERVGIDVSNIK